MGRRFRDDEIGSMSIFSVFMFMTILILGGLGIDMMAAELRRMKLQATLDRAVLAAASLSQGQDEETIVRDYFAKSGMLEYLDRVTPFESDDGNTKTVFAEASAPRDSLFLKLVGVDQLKAPAKGTATETRNDVEISLVLDISGSMKDNQKLENLQDAASEFVRTMVNENTRNRVSLSLVPYSEHVAAGPNLMNQLNVNLLHPYSWCVEFPDSEFGDIALDRTLTYDQVPHFQWNFNGSTNAMDAPVCPQQSYEAITPLSQDQQALIDQIEALQPRSGTAIFLGMKWGAAMLDPSFRGVTQALVAANVVDGAFVDRPVAFPAEGEESTTYKTVVLMTDGKNDFSNRIKPANYATYDQRALWAKYSLGYWANFKSGQTTIKNTSEWNGSTEKTVVGIGGLLGAGSAAEDLVNVSNGLLNGVGVCSNNGIGVGLGLDGNQGSGIGNVDLCDIIGNASAATTYGYSFSDYYKQKYTATLGDTLLQNICTAAKDEGIIIWSIAFETDEHGTSEMQKCASSPNHFFDVEGTQIRTAFNQIANQIKRLKLIN
ncbi:Tad domain-containing protein [Mesobacterium pallidum]|uniref:Tad domain-containing protein n=1 Tax=Mesobacterium pallidum TaxID=2872037 RepID=UPI001EE1B501|nr:Tad domain-containing protein [Mesobacterium pallidum]